MDAGTYQRIPLRRVPGRDKGSIYSLYVPHDRQSGKPVVLAKQQLHQTAQFRVATITDILP